MKRLTFAVAAALAVAALPSFAQDAVRYAQEPTASISTNAGPDGPAALSIAQQINADPTFQESKITVQPIEGGITLTGITKTYAQQRRAVEIATKEAGEGRVVNAILSPEVVMWAPPVVETE